MLLLSYPRQIFSIDVIHLSLFFFFIYTWRIYSVIHVSHVNARYCIFSFVIAESNSNWHVYAWVRKHSHDILGLPGTFMNRLQLTRVEVNSNAWWLPLQWKSYLGTTVSHLHLSRLPLQKYWLAQALYWILKYGVSYKRNNVSHFMFFLSNDLTGIERERSLLITQTGVSLSKGSFAYIILWDCFIHLYSSHNS